MYRSLKLNSSKRVYLKINNYGSYVSQIHKTVSGSFFLLCTQTCAISNSLYMQEMKNKKKVGGKKIIFSMTCEYVP